jgi:UDP-glucose 4-epimerase
MKILVTGALGHIGSYIVRQIPLSFPNSEILMVDNLMTM